LIGPKADYSSVIDHDSLHIAEGRSAVGSHQAQLYDTLSVHNDNQDGDNSEGLKKPSNTINRRPSIVGGQCPFSALKMTTNE